MHVPLRYVLRCVVVMVFSWTVKFITIDAATAADCGVCWCCVWWKAKMVEYGCIFPVSLSLSRSSSMRDAPHKTHSKIIVIIIINGFRRVHRMDTVYSNSHSTTSAASASAVAPSLAAWTANGIQSKHILITLSKMADQITVWCARAFYARRNIRSEVSSLATRPPCPSPFD